MGVRIVGRKNKRKRSAYSRKMRTNPKRLITKGPEQVHKSPVIQGTEIVQEERSGIVPHRGEIWFAELGEHPGTSVQEGCLSISVRKKHICIRIYPACNSIVFPAHFHDLSGNCNASVLVPFRVCNINRALYKIKILLCKMSHFLRSHARGILEPENDSGGVCQERVPFVIRVIVSCNKKAPQFPVIHDIWQTPSFMAEIICRENACRFAGHDLVSAKIPDCGNVNPDFPPLMDGIQIGEGYFPCKDTGIRKLFLAVMVKIRQFLCIA